MTYHVLMIVIVMGSSHNHVLPYVLSQHHLTNSFHFKTVEECTRAADALMPSYEAIDAICLDLDSERAAY